MPTRRFYVPARRFHSTAARVKVLAGHFGELAGVRSTARRRDRQVSEGLYAA